MMTSQIRDISKNFLMIWKKSNHFLLSNFLQVFMIIFITIAYFKIMYLYIYFNK